MIAESTITAALVGVIIVLTKVIEWLIQRARDAKRPAASPYNGDAHKLEHSADRIHDCGLKMEICVDRLERIVDKLDRGS